MSGTMCIGRIGGRKGDWYAQLNMDDYEATVNETPN